jgi:hypothetical protein
VKPARFPAACEAPPQVFATALPYHAASKVVLRHAPDATFAGYFGYLLRVGGRAPGGRSEGGWIKSGDEGREIPLEAMQGGLFACRLLSRALERPLQ